jgi:glycosyltransferase involved in cell wall biosynthesis
MSDPKLTLFLPNIKDGGGVGEYCKWVKKEFPKFQIETINDYEKQTNLLLLLSLAINFINIPGRLARNKRMAQNDIVWVQYPLLMLLFSSKKVRKLNPNVKIVLHYHGSSENFKHGLYKLYKLIIFKMKNQYDQLIILGENDLQHYESLKKQVNVLHNPSKLIPSSTIKDFQNTYTYIGRLENGKGIFEMIEIFKKFPQAQLNIYGSGSLSQKVTKDIENSQSIIYHGKTNNVKEVFDKTNYLVLLSDFEGLPLTFVEAASQNIPIITTKSSPLICDIVTNSKNGHILKDKNDLENILNTTINNPIHYNKLANEMSISKNKFSNQVIKQKINEIILEKK